MRKTLVLIALLGLSASGRARAEDTAPQPQAAPAVLPMPEEGRGLGPAIVADGDGSYRLIGAPFAMRIDRDGSLHFGHRATFDMTDALMRAHGEDPYRYEKTQLMEKTRPTRMMMAAAARRERLREAVARMPGYLDKVWATQSWPAARRRLALFALWEEVEEDGDRDLVDAGSMVRRTIVAFIRRRLPEGSADAFTARELADLNRWRDCKARFEPYGR